MLNGERPDLGDFRSPSSVGSIIDPGASQEERDTWDGISAFDTIGKARGYARRATHIAELRILETTNVSYEQTFQKGHYTLRGRPEDMLAAVVDVVRV
jgi:hypothetical protein